MGPTLYYHYEGTGVVMFEVSEDGKTADLRLYPDVVVLKEKLGGDKPWTAAPFDDPLTRLEEHDRAFQMKLEPWATAIIETRKGESWVQVSPRAADAVLRPGIYRLRLR